MPTNATVDIFHSEVELVAAFAECLGAGGLLRNVVGVSHEFDYQSGRTDVVSVCSKEYVHAYEAKLKNWRVALHQARRNTCFAHYSYVVLPAGKRAIPPKKRIDFERFGVGLIVVSESTSRVAIRAQKHKPLMPWLTNAARASALPPLDASNCPPTCC